MSERNAEKWATIVTALVVLVVVAVFIIWGFLAGLIVASAVGVLSVALSGIGRVRPW